MRHLAIVALFLAACGGKSDQAGTAPTVEVPADAAAAATRRVEVHAVEGVLQDIALDGDCEITLGGSATDTDTESYPAPDLCGQGYQDWIGMRVDLTLDAEGKVTEMSVVEPAP